MMRARERKIGSAFYNNADVTIANRTLVNINWDSIQITPTPTGDIEITENVFWHTNTKET